MESKEGQASHHQQLDGEALCDSFSSSASVTEADGDAPPWQPVPFATRSPGSRVFPSAVVHAECLYIFGGHDGGVYRNDLLIFSLETRAWQLDFEPSGGWSCSTNAAKSFFVQQPTLILRRKNVTTRPVLLMITAA